MTVWQDSESCKNLGEHSSIAEYALCYFMSVTFTGVEVWAIGMIHGSMGEQDFRNMGMLSNKILLCQCCFHPSSPQ